MIVETSINSFLVDESAKTDENIENTYHRLENKWVLWCHLPHDTDWASITSYKKICDFSYIEDVISINNIIPEQIINSCCFFIMKKGITPMWEDKNNRNGGCFSYRITNKHVYQTWKELSFVLTGETISNNNNFVSNVTGISISPKKNFCVMKVWMRNCDFQNPDLITNEIKTLIPNTALFKVHTPEF